MSLLLCKRTRSRTPQGKECVQGKPLPGFWIWMAAPSGASQAFCRRQNLGAGKTLAQAEFISAEHVKYPWGGAARGRECRHSRIPQGKECVQGKPLPGFPCTFNQRPPQAALIFASQKSAVPSLAPNNKTTPKGWFCWCERWDLNPHDLTNTGTSSLPVCLFQHARGQNTHLL